MAADIDGLDQSENLTNADIPALDPDEYISLRRVTDALRDMAAEMRSYSTFTLADDSPDPDEEGGDAPTTTKLDTPTYLKWRFLYMVTGWKLWKPPTPAQRAAGAEKGDEIPFTEGNKDKVFRLFGPYIIPAMAARGGGIAKPPPEGKKDADGSPLTFREKRPVRGEKHLAGPVDAGSLRAGAASTDRQGVGV